MELSPKIRVAAVDDHQIFIAGLERAVKWAGDVELVASGSSGADALLIAATVQPDIMLLDISMPGDGIQCARQIASAQPLVKTVMLTASNDDEQLARALAAGAKGFLLKGIQLSELLEAIRAVHGGETYLSPDVAARLLARKSRNERREQGIQAAIQDLNPREQSILFLMVQGKTNLEIANQTGLSVSTVKTYISRIFDKMKVHNRVQAVRIALGQEQPC